MRTIHQYGLLLALTAAVTVTMGATYTYAQGSGVQLNTATTNAGEAIDPASFAPCDQEMTTCPCNGIRVNKDIIKSGDVLMLRLKDTSVVSFPLRIE